MFKSVFAKYVTVITVLFVLVFSLLLILMTTIIGNYSEAAKEDLMSNTANATKVYVEAFVDNFAPDRFEKVLNAYVSYGERPLDTLLNAYTANNEDINVLLSDREGNLLYCTGSRFEQPLINPDGKLPVTLTEQVVASQTHFLERTELPLFDSSMLASTVGIYNDSGELCGIVVVCAKNHGWGDMAEELTGTVIVAGILVMLATMIAVYLVSERTTAPLRQMSVVARRLAAGSFDSRVAVKGNDEVAELAVAFNQMAESLENLEKMRSSFIANVSHDLRTPMTTIAGFIDGIRDGVIPKEEQPHYLEIISTEVRRLSRLVSSLLDLSRLQAGDKKLTYRAFDICEMGRIILISFEQQIGEKELEVEFEAEEDRMMVYADHDSIYQVFYNICHNAIKFSSPRGIYRIRIRRTNEKKIAVSVYNDGVGIPKEDLPYVFDRFYKSDKSRGLDKNSVGLGMFISKTIIKAHGEDISVVSEEGKNCEFLFTLSPAPET